MASLSSFSYRRAKSEARRESLFSFLSLFLHLLFLAFVVHSLLKQPPPVPPVEMYTVTLMQELAPPPPPPEVAQEPTREVKPQRKQKATDVRKDIGLTAPKKVKKEVKKKKRFHYRKKQRLAKKKVKVHRKKPVEAKQQKKKVLHKKKVVKPVHIPTMEEELRELEQERLSRAKARGTKEEKQPHSVSLEAKVDALQFPFAWYIEALKRQVDSHWEEETGSALLHCVVLFEIARDGKLIRSEVEKSSGLAGFDLSALRAVADSHFPPLPSGYNEPSLRVHFGFISE